MENVDDANQPEKVNDQPEAVPSDVYNQTKNDMHKYKRMSQEAAEREAKLQAELAAIKEAKQAEDGQFKQLWEQGKVKYSELEEKFNGFTRAVQDDKKLTAVREYAIQNNIRPEALDDLDIIDMSEVVIETTDRNRINVHGAADFVQKLKAAKPYWFKDESAPNVNNAVPGNNDNFEDKTYSASELLELQKKDPSAYKEVMTNKRHLIRR